MRKLIFLFVLVVFCYASVFSPPVQASLVKSFDTNGSPILYSTIKLRNEPWSAIGLWRTLEPGAPYHLELVTDGYKEWIFFEGKVSMRVQDTWYELSVEQQNTKTDWPNVTTTAQHTIPQPAIEQLLKLQGADTVELRLKFQDKTFVQWNVPDNVLIEWQQLIRRVN